jgi:predicted NBD/HSP70 family sugar kinase
VRDAIERGERSVLGASDRPPGNLTAEDVVAAAKQGDSVARAALEQTGEALGAGIANAVQLLNPSLVALAGRFSNTARDFLLDAVTRVSDAHCFQTISRGMEIRVAPFRKDIGPVGCALLATVDVASQLVGAGAIPLRKTCVRLRTEPSVKAAECEAPQPWKLSRRTCSIRLWRRG